jgi:N-acylneuraminate cytidylyltransferase
MNKNKKNFIAIIPARKGSKEIKNKNLILINGHPLLSYSIAAAKKSKFIKDVFVSTDGKNIAKVARRYGAKVVIRPKKLSKDSSRIEDAILYTVKHIKNLLNPKYDNIVLMQPTSPQRSINDLDNAIRKFIKDKADSLFSCTKQDLCIWENKNSKIIPVNFNPYKRKNRQEKNKSYIENGSIYVTKKKIYDTYKNRLGGKISIYIMENYARHELDTKNDSKFITSILSAQIAKKFKLTVPRKIK